MSVISPASGVNSMGMDSAHLMVEIVPLMGSLVPSFRGARETLPGNKETFNNMKREGNLFPKIISDENLRKAIVTVCKSHRWCHYPDKPNQAVIRLQSDLDARVEELRSLIVNGFVPSPVKKKRRYDNNAGKWREISEPRLWPDQCVHHALIQVLEPVMMRGMDHWCCGSIRGRGAHYGIRAIKKWMKRGKGVKWCIELDIHHFYESLKPEQVRNRLLELIKDRRAIDMAERIIEGGVLIGAYCSQWFANTVLQPLDQLIRRSGATHYIRYMDNFTIFTNRKKTADRIIRAVSEWLESHGLRLKDNWQKFMTSKRMPNALGYRYSRKHTVMRKMNRKRLIDQLDRFYYLRESGKFVPVRFAQGLLSRLGMLRHCDHVRFYERFVRKKTQRQLKNIVRAYYRKERSKWTTSSDMSISMA